MMNVEITGIEQLRAQLSMLSDRRFSAGIATALTRTAVKVRDDAQNYIRGVLDRPTPYTVKQLRYVHATADRLMAGVGFNISAIQDISGKTLRFEEEVFGGGTPANKYLPHNIEGGQRPLKRLEVALRAANALPAGSYVVPSKYTPLDAYGNVSRGLTVQILSQLRIQLVSGFSRNMNWGRSAIRAQRRAGGRFFVMRAGRGVQPGIYMRDFYSEVIVPVFIFVKRANYKKRFAFYARTESVGNRTLPGEVVRALADQIKRAAQVRRA
jgi:hypothetical protein